MNPLDMPPPDLPDGVTPQTFPEMHRRIAERLESVGASPAEAIDRAWQALDNLFQSGHLEPWGMNEYGEPLYTPSTPVVVYMRRK